jgi:hypothetical protein
MEKDSIVEAVRQDLLDRSQKGIIKYNTTLDRQDLNLKEWLQHAYEECLDQANYLKRSIIELENKKTSNSNELFIQWLTGYINGVLELNQTKMPKLEEIHLIVIKNEFNRMSKITIPESSIYNLIPLENKKNPYNMTGKSKWKVTYNYISSK